MKSFSRVLKRSPNTDVLEVVLEGVAKLGHLIGVEFYDDLLTLMKDILTRNDLTHKQRLHCVLSIFRLAYRHQKYAAMGLTTVPFQLF